ncbi:MAG: hypothetical protein ACYTGX_03915 [Planctomycetota bacterium]
MIIDRFTEEEKATLRGLGKTLAALQGFCGLAMFLAALMALVAVVAALFVLDLADDGTTKMMAIAFLAASPVFVISAWMLFRSAKDLVNGVREGSEVCLRRMQRTLAAAVPLGLASTALIGLLAFDYATDGAPDDLVALVMFGGLGLAGNITPVMALWALVRYRAFIRVALHDPIPRTGTRDDDLDKFLHAAAIGTSTKEPRKRRRRLRHDLHRPDDSADVG